MSIQIHVSSTSPIATAMMPGTRILAISRSCSRSRLTQPHITPHPRFPFFIRLGHSARGNAMTRPRGVQVFIGIDVETLVPVGYDFAGRSVVLTGGSNGIG